MQKLQDMLSCRIINGIFDRKNIQFKLYEEKNFFWPALATIPASTPARSGANGSH